MAEEDMVETADMVAETEAMVADTAAGRTPSWPAWEIQVLIAPRWLARVVRATGTALLAEAVTGHTAEEEDMGEEVMVEGMVALDITPVHMARAAA
jgi:hypothetical protein